LPASPEAFDLVPVNGAAKREGRMTWRRFAAELSILRTIAIRDRPASRRGATCCRLMPVPSKVSLPHLIQDRQYLRDQSLRGGGDILLATPIQYFQAPDDGRFGDGPVHPRVAVVDLDADRRILRPPLRFKPRAIGRTVSAYDLLGAELGPDSPIEAFESDEFLKLNPFATVIKTLAFFESPEILGRTIRWAFPSEQLLVVPRAGEMKNAFYDRASGSLQFYHHTSGEGFTVYTALSHDIIIHEATHAIVDGLLPDLYDSADPQSLALHEALADLSAITQTLINEMIVFSLDSISSSGIDTADVLSRLAEEFGSDSRTDQGASFLRRLKNDRTLRPDDDSVDELGTPNRPRAAEPHALSQVLSGAVYAVFARRLEEPLPTRRRDDLFAGLETSFCPSARHVARIVFRALDYMPPGEAGFVDYGRAFVAAARATYRRVGLEREVLADELVRRGIVSNAADLEQPDSPDLRLDAARVERLRADRRALAKLARDHAGELGLPAGGEVELLEPVRAERSLRSNPGAKRKPETVFRFRWTEAERHDLGRGLPETWSVRRGTTLVVDADGKVLSLLTSDRGESAPAAAGRPSRRAGRAALLERWKAEGRLQLAADAVGPDGKPRRDAVLLELADGAARTVGGGRTLHLARDPG
jgi:hypothetical protein